MDVCWRTSGILVERERFIFSGDLYITYDVKGWDGNIYPGPTIKRNVA